MEKNIDLKLYNVFLKVYETKKISSAAEILFVTQPSISYSIKELEKQLGITLFKRTSKGVEPTLEAEKLYYYISNALNIIHVGEKRINENTNEENTIKVGVPSHICSCFLSEYIESFCEIYPKIKFELIDLSTSSMVYMIESRKIDLIVDSLPIKSDKFNLEIVNLISLSTCFAGNKNFFKTNDFKLKDLEKLPFIIPNNNASITKLLNNYLLQYKIHIKSKINIWTTEMMKDFVMRGMGVGFFIKYAIKDIIKSEDMLCLDFNDSLPKVNVCLAFIPEFQNHTTNLFIKYLKDKISN